VSRFVDHTGPVAAVAFSTLHPDTLFSGSWDHSIRQWDVNQESNVATINCETTVLDLKESASGLLATGHSDCLVRLWDTRTGLAMRVSLSSHTNWSSCVAWSPDNGNHVASGGYDGNVKIWDIRSSSVPLYSIASVETPGEKVLCVDWTADAGLVSGGSDGKIRIHALL
jgi:ribosome biogenesis protein YTM1